MNKLILHILCLTITSFVFGQDLYDHKLNKTKWENIKDGIRYEGKENIGPEWSYESKKDYQKALKEKNSKQNTISSKNKDKNLSSQDELTPEKYENNTDYDSGFNPNLTGLSWLGWLLIIIIGVGLIILIVYMIISNQDPGKTKIKNIDDLDNIAPAEIPLTELQKRLKEALDKKDFRGAIRIYYLFILKDLSEKKWIFWQKEKTNSHYLNEMIGKAEYNDFNKTISYFEIIWYGKRDISQSQFTTIQPYFTTLLKNLDIE